MEEIYAFQDEQPYEVLHKLLVAHHHVSVYLSDDEFDDLVFTNECLRYLAKRTLVNKKLDITNTLLSYHETVAATPSEELAGTVFIVDDTPESCAELSNKYGVCIVSRQNPAEASYLTEELARKEIRTANSYRYSTQGKVYVGWKAALNPRSKRWQATPMNSLVVIDNYMFGDKGDRLAIGQENILSLLDALLPSSLSVDFHLLLVTANEQAFLKSRNLHKLTQYLQGELKRPYAIQVGVITRDVSPEHRRALISNYYFGASHHGFACFKGHKTQWPNDLVVSGIFRNVEEEGFDVPWISMHDELRAVRIQRDKNRKLRNPDSGYDDPTHLVYGFCDNRLLELVP
ncbi:hypothetical protein MUN84_18645 [Hymenobacter sp. 5516J-16]|uniref:hypothetical protein n=1 Tax=Hymenobacter sp. 5516J-16 TaxID=2932253 RepID=UPI001FD3D294|nr:hypothetical protein [Hymenobacter sp. 5516J-16]UOQ76533.1 hypothetical protein MUN84_18645 [Hymenobacter sp. 5516J-16]